MLCRCCTTGVPNTQSSQTTQAAMGRSSTMKEVRVWRRPIHDQHDSPADEERLVPEAYFITGNTFDAYECTSNTHEASDLSSGVRVFKYKMVDKRICPVPAIMPEDVKVRWTFPINPLENLSILPTCPPEFTPIPKMTQERMDKLGINDNSDLSDEEKSLLKYVLVINEHSIAFTENERGTFRHKYFSDYQIPVTSHVPVSAQYLWL